MRVPLYLVVVLCVAHCFTVAAVTGDSGVDSREVFELPETGPGQERKLPVGKSLRLDDLGPTIVSEEGELRRIQNWDQLSDHEKKVAWKRLQKRNLERLAELRKHSQEADLHDTTLSDGETDSRSPEERAAAAQEHLGKFMSGLSELKKKGEIPGFQGFEELLEDPSSGDRHDVDPKLLRERLAQLKQDTEKMKQASSFRHDEL